MAYKPILFNTDMVRAILRGHKTQTRRLVRPHYHDGDAGFYVVTNKATGKFSYIEYYDEEERGTDRYLYPPYGVGDILWVRETWKQATGDTIGGGAGLYDTYLYKADEPQDTTGMMVEDRWHPSIHMPRKAARIFLRVTGVRAERLQHISRGDAIKEGCNAAIPILEFKQIWNITIKEPNLVRFGWDANPWVWVIEFERLAPQPAGLFADRDTAQYADGGVLMPTT